MSEEGGERAMAPGPSGAKAARVEADLQEGNMTSRSDRGALMSPGLLKVAKRAQRDPDARFNSLAHLVDRDAGAGLSADSQGCGCGGGWHHEGGVWAATGRESPGAARTAEGDAVKESQ
jgi:hypothetical protein